jgi:N-acetylglutamate synthase-like GNAT family acetyltransferase
MRLNRGGVLPGGGQADRSLDDLNRMEKTYFGRPQDHFWVAEANGRLVGMIGLVQRRPHVAVIRRLRVAPVWADTDLGRRLVKRALWHSWLHGAVKVVIDAPCDVNWAIRFLGELGFRYTCVRNRDGRDQIDFYPTLYAKPHYAAMGA